mgnify:CR=1 FL=1
MGARKVNVSALSSKAEKALRQAVRRVIEEHQRNRQPIIVWEQGKVVRVPADRLTR